MAVRKVLLLNGPNLDMLGTREPDIYGHDTLTSLEMMVAQYAGRFGISIGCYQSNSEAQLIDCIHAARDNFDGIVYNPGAHTHYSYALRDAVAGISIPTVEVHISAVNEREPFRHVSVIAPACVAQVKGLGFEGYCRAIDILRESDGLPRLGEGYEERFPAESDIIIAGTEAKATAQAEPAAVEAEPAVAAQLAQPAVAATQAAAYEPRYAVASQFIPEPAPLAIEGAQEAASASVTVAQPVGAVPAEAAPAAAEPVFPLDDGIDDGIDDVDDFGGLEDFAAPYAPDVYAADPAQASAERIAKVRQACGQLGIDALLIRDTSNIRWLTALDGVFDEERAHALLVTPADAALHTDSRYSNAIRSAAQAAGNGIAISDETVSHVEFAGARLAAAAQAPFSGRLGFEDSISYAEFAKLAGTVPPANLAATADVVVGLRAVKTRPELSRLLAAQAVTDAAFEHIIAFMRPGMTERQVQLELEDYMLRHGGEGLAFSSIVATGANGADPHAIPGDTRLEAGQCVVMDFGARAYGYCSDMTRTVFLGQPDQELAHAWDVLRQANETVEALLRPGVTGKQAHETAERVLAEGGFAGKMGHGLGHGVGIDVHEQPVLNTRNDRPLEAGNVVTVEPGIYLPGRFGMRLEDCGVITLSAYEPFSQLGHEMVVI